MKISKNVGQFNSDHCILFNKCYLLVVGSASKLYHTNCIALWYSYRCYLNVNMMLLKLLIKHLVRCDSDDANDICYR